MPNRTVEATTLERRIANLGAAIEKQRGKVAKHAVGTDAHLIATRTMRILTDAYWTMLREKDDA